MTSLHVIHIIYKFTRTETTERHETSADILVWVDRFMFEFT